MKILCTSDIHLGRQPSLKAFPGQELTFRSAWDFVVASALRLKPDLLILAGDVVERDNRYFEAWAPLREDVLRLLQAGLTIAAIAGNHDAEVLPRLHAEVLRDLAPADAARFILLGQDPGDGRMGQWTQAVVRFGVTSLRLVGWSFPARHHHTDPLQAFPALPGDLPILGILHGDLDVPGTPYAPFTTAGLQAAQVDRWVLGHIHAPTARGAAPFYCGSPLPLRASETGAHGCWLLELEGRTWLDPQLVPAPLRIEALEVPLTLAATSQAHVQAAIHQAMQEALLRCQAQAPDLAGVLFRVALTGETRLPELDLAEGFTFTQDGVQAALHGAPENRTHPPLPLEAWRQEKGAKGMLAGLILDLDAGLLPPGAWEDLQVELRALERESRAASAYASLEPVGSEAGPQALLRRTCVRLLTALAAAEAHHA
jgi:DNA repair exonuclease SbcCD nuclease subunit